LIKGPGGERGRKGSLPLSRLLLGGESAFTGGGHVKREVAKKRRNKLGKERESKSWRGTRTLGGRSLGS